MTPNPGNVPETGIPPIDNLLIWCSAAVALAAGIALGWRIIRWLRHIGRRVGDLADDWHGVTDRPGVPGRPGIMTRLARIEQQGAEQAERLRRVEHELHPNSGASLRDAVDRVDIRTARIAPDPE